MIYHALFFLKLQNLSSVAVVISALMANQWVLKYDFRQTDGETDSQTDNAKTITL